MTARLHAACRVAGRARERGARAGVCAGLLALAHAPLACAHVLTGAERAAPTFGWSFDAWVVVLMLASTLAYAVGYVRLRLRGSPRSRATRAWHASAFAAGMAALVFALCSPLDSLSAALFSAHMVQHETMMLIAAPLLVLGRPLGVWIWALPRAARRRIGRAVRAPAVARAWRGLTAPLAGWTLHAAALWGWHAPVMFEAALAHPWVHTLQHTSFMLTALVFWWTVFGDGASRQSGGHAMLSVFTTMVHTSALGALISLAPGLWYPSYVEPTSALGIDPLHDQQAGGLIMWVPGAMAYLIGGLAIAARWLRGHEPPRVIADPAAALPQDGGR
ncbi:cytochrome c oxidase caa3 assembly factor family protein [Paraburkholderia xenovorans LB400]|uniref:Membrane protein n=2 Tax=Paraburkholderia xenovorans TaxID=36873 RepID=Q13IJ4_PARXL|nr:Putative membrane protein [Paraburkholderia xenovorans LB400]AIP34961.1 cytochrome c oxidase caa3 assembly factor family protein [Paraburkholderia xenovorans LB400]